MQTSLAETKTGLTAEHLCAIIKQCAESGVSELKLGDLSVSFTQKCDETKAATWTRPASHSETEISEADFKKIDLERLEQDEQQLREQQLAEMLLTDPLAYEELLSAGELEDRNGE